MNLLKNLNITRDTISRVQRTFSLYTKKNNKIRIQKWGKKSSILEEIKVERTIPYVTTLDSIRRYNAFSSQKTCISSQRLRHYILRFLYSCISELRFISSPYWYYLCMVFFLLLYFWVSSNILCIYILYLYKIILYLYFEISLRLSATFNLSWKCHFWPLNFSSLFAFKFWIFTFFFKRRAILSKISVSFYVLNFFVIFTYIL